MRQIFDGVNNAWLSSWFKFCWTKFDKICQIIQMLDISWSKLFSQLVLLGKQWESSSAWGSSPLEPGSLMITMYRFWDIHDCIFYELRTKELSNELFFWSSVSQYHNFYSTVQKRQCINDNLHQFLLSWLEHCHIALIITGPMPGWWLPRMTIGAQTCQKAPDLPDHPWWLQQWNDFTVN